jgi:hypothetical protein
MYYNSIVQERDKERTITMTITLFTIIGVFATIIAFLVSGLILAAYVKGWREGCGFDLSDAVVFGVSALVFVCSMLALVVH